MEANERRELERKNLQRFQGQRGDTVISGRGLFMTLRESGDERVFVDGRRSDPQKALSLTRRRRTWIWLPAKPGLPGGTGATEGVRGRVTSLDRGR